MQPKAFFIAASAALALSACNGALSNNPIVGGFGNKAYVRFVHGSPDAGPVDVMLDGKMMPNAGNLAYGGVTPYTAASAGQHTMTIYKAGNDTGASLGTLNVSVNTGQDNTVVLEGELHPTYVAKANLGLQNFVEQPFQTPGGGGAVNFHDAAPITNGTPMQFGYTVNGTAANNAVGGPVPYGQATNPQGLPSTALNTPLTLYAGNNRQYTTTPNQIAGGCTGIPCSQPNLSLYLVDGPRASRQPTTPPSNVDPRAKAVFFGAFDANGLVAQ